MSIRAVEAVCHRLASDPDAGISLVGFSGSSAEGEVERSRKYAELVAQEFIKRGVVPVHTIGLGALNPVIPEQTSEARRRNRRVEIWVNRPK